MLVSLTDTTGKTLHLNPQFVSAVKARGAGCVVIYDIAGNMFYVTDDAQVVSLAAAMKACKEVVILPPRVKAVGKLFPLGIGEDDFDPLEMELEEVIEEEEEAPPPPAKKRSRSKKNAS